jgi:hypothetical protein
MSTIDKQRIAAVAALEALGFAYSPHSLLILRADKLAGCTEGSEEATELEFVRDALEAYEALRWPEGKIPGGKG